eukprot:3809904-Prymnesium_polylepis.1
MQRPQLLRHLRQIVDALSVGRPPPVERRVARIHSIERRGLHVRLRRQHHPPARLRPPQPEPLNLSVRRTVVEA